MLAEGGESIVLLDVVGVSVVSFLFLFGMFSSLQKVFIRERTSDELPPVELQNFFISSSKIISLLLLQLPQHLIFFSLLRRKSNKRDLEIFANINNRGLN